MKNILLPILCLFVFGKLISQTKQQMANYYFQQYSLPKTNIKQENLIQTIQKLDLDSLETWSSKNYKYWNLLVFSAKRFRKSEDLKTIWEANFRNDPYETCEKFREVLSLENGDFNYPKTSQLLFVHLLQEYDYYDSVCVEYLKEKSPQIATQLQKIKKDYQLESTNKKSRHEIQTKNENSIESIIQKLGKYPGRSIVGKELEEVPYLVLRNSSLQKIEKYLPIVLNAINNKDLDPKYATLLSEQIILLKK